jgi:hypothetical protein
LFGANPGIHQDLAISGIDQQAAHGPGAKVVFIRRIEFLPHALGHYAKHGTAIEFEIARIDGNEFHRYGCSGEKYKVQRESCYLVEQTTYFEFKTVPNAENQPIRFFAPCNPLDFVHGIQFDRSRRFFDQSQIRQ